jgi:SAM-dependent methyltransferase
MNSKPLSRAERVLQEVRDQIEPDDPGLAEWCGLYWIDHKERIRQDLMLCEQYFRGRAAILDVGCIPPFLSGALKLLEFPVSGVDIAPERFAHSIEKLSLTIHKCDIEKEPLPFPDKTFDGVILNEVLEHLRIDLIFTLREIHRTMRQGGILMLSTPNLYSFRGILNFLRNQRAFSVAGSTYTEFQKLHRLGHMGHVREYTPVEVEELMVQCGFVPHRRIFRGKGARKIECIITKIFPKLQPFFTVILQRP